MNRLEAARRIRRRLDVELDGGEAIHFDFSYRNGDDESDYTMCVKRATSHMGSFSEQWSEWEPVGWKDVLKFIRENFPRRVEGQCNYRFDMYDDHGRIHAEDGYMTTACIETREHFHCKSCGDPEAHIGCYSKLCGKCEEQSDKKRREITNLILNYEGDFGIPFKEIQEWREAWSGYDDYRSRGRSDDYEDFHADG